MEYLCKLAQERQCFSKEHSTLFHYTFPGIIFLQSCFQNMSLWWINKGCDYVVVISITFYVLYTYLHRPSCYDYLQSLFHSITTWLISQRYDVFRALSPPWTVLLRCITLEYFSQDKSLNPYQLSVHILQQNSILWLKRRRHPPSNSAPPKLYTKPTREQFSCPEMNPAWYSGYMQLTA